MPNKRRSRSCFLRQHDGCRRSVGGQARWDQDAGFAGAPNRPTRKRPLRRGVGCPELPARAGRALPHGEEESESESES